MNVLLQDLLERSAQRSPNRLALVTPERRMTFAEIDAEANALAHAFIERGVEKGDRVLIFGPNDFETVVSFWGALKANGVPIVIHPQTRASKLAFLLKDCEPALVVAEARLRPVVREAGAASALYWGKGEQFERVSGATRSQNAPLRTNEGSDLAAIIYTSGSTGEPKGVMLSHQNMLAAAHSVATYLGITADDVILNVLPLSFDYGLYQIILAAKAGAEVVLESSFNYPAEVLPKIARERVTSFPVVPTLCAILGGIQNLETYDFSTVRFVTNTAAALTGKHISILEKTFPKARIFSMFGLTECKRVSYLPPEDLKRKPHSVGIPIPGTEFWVVDESGNRLPAGQVGQLVVRGPHVMMGYWRRPEESSEKLRSGPNPGEKVLYTGDYASLDEEGHLFFVGRKDDIIKSRGEKVAPKEVENALMEIPGVREVAVVGVPDDLLGEAVKAFVVLDSGFQLTGGEIVVQCRQRLEGFMVPKTVEIVPDLPKTSTGKIEKVSLR